MRLPCAFLFFAENVSRSYLKPVSKIRRLGVSRGFQWGFHSRRRFFTGGFTHADFIFMGVSLTQTLLLLGVSVLQTLLYYFNFFVPVDLIFDVFDDVIMKGVFNT